MIHVATAHYGTDRWIDVQLSYLHRNISEPFKVWASLQHVPGEHNAKFHRTVPSAGPHSGKLNLLAGEIAAEARSGDILLFLDGDAFPIRDPLPTIRSGLETSVLVAVRRDENATDRQPHPCFCAVTVGEWERIHGDWSPGYGWETNDGSLTTDVGGNLLRILERSATPWTPLLRSNRVDLHPLWFAVYGDIAYHHGAGFRWAIGRIDLEDQPPSRRWTHALPVAGRLLRRWDKSRSYRWKDSTRARAEQQGAEMFERIRDDPDFYLDLV
jgi:hypothetical protein